MTTDLDTRDASEPLEPNALDPDFVGLDARQPDEVHRVIVQLLDRLDTALHDADLPLAHAAQQLEHTARRLIATQDRYAEALARTYNDSAHRPEKLGLPAGRTAYTNASDFLAQHLGIAPAEANARIRRADQLLPPTTNTDDADAADPADPTGPIDPTDPASARYPQLAARVQGGAVDPRKFDTALNTLAQFDRHLAPLGVDDQTRTELLRQFEAALAEKIETTSPAEYRRLAARRLESATGTLQPQNDAATHDQAAALHGVHRIGPVKGNPQAIKWVHIVDPETDELKQTFYATASNPRTQRSTTTGTTTPSQSANEPTDHRDTRSRAAQIMHAERDSLRYLLTQLHEGGFAGATSQQALMVVTIDHQTLLDDVVVTSAASRNQSTEDWTTHRSNSPINDPTARPPISAGTYTPDMPADTLRRMACDIGLIPITLTGDSQVLDVGTEAREFDRYQRAAIVARDGGCTAPGCYWYAAWCELHHVVPWSQRGPTSVHQGALLCPHHHAAVHAGQLSISESDDGFVFTQVTATGTDPPPARRNHYWRN